MNNNEHVLPEEPVRIPSETHTYKCVGCVFSWKAVLVGAVAAIGLAFLSHLLIIGIALVTYQPDQQTLFVMSMVGVALLAVLTYLITFISGWLAGRLASIYHVMPTTRHGLLHGFIAWCLALLISLVVVAHLPKTPMRAFLSPNISSQMLSQDTTSTPRVALNTTTLGQATLIIFGIALLGAISSSVGGACGIKHHSREIETTRVTTRNDVNVP